jgi:hypothetical protein
VKIRKQHMTVESSKLWSRLKEFELDDSNSQLTFTDRLARENGWTHKFAVRAVLEYKKFIFLISVSNQPLTPSDEVDQVWHLHLLYTHSYWRDMCDGLLNKEIHHGPTKGGQDEGLKFTDWYLKTIELYKVNFGGNPPDDIWPPKEIRFKNVNFQRVNRNSHWVLKKPFT